MEGKTIQRPKQLHRCLNCHQLYAKYRVLYDYNDGGDEYVCPHCSYDGEEFVTEPEIIESWCKEQESKTNSASKRVA